MKNQYIIAFLLILIFIVSCKKKKEIQPVYEPSNSELNVFWQKALLDSNEIYSSIHPIVYNDFIISSYYKNTSGISESLFALNKLDGSSVWYWNDYIRAGQQKVRGADRLHTKGNALLACSSQDNYGIDMNSGQTIWATNLEDGNPRTSHFDNLLFHTITYGTAPFGDSTKVIVRPTGIGEWSDVFNINKTDSYEVNFEPPSMYINDGLDTILIFQNRQIDLLTYDEKVDLYCYNMTQDSLIWFKEDLTSSGSSNVRVPIVEGDRVYFAGKWDFFCIDILSGEIVWMHNFYHSYQSSNFLINNDLIITNLDNGDLIAINKYTGDQEWVNTSLSGCCTELRIYEDRIYFGNDNLYIVDATNGDLLYKFKSPHPNGSFRNAIAVDVPSKRMYTTDGIYIMCMELPE